MIKKYRWCIIIFYICALASLITATFVDLRLDIWLNNPTDPFSKWFEGTGELPCRMIGVAAGLLIFYLCEKPLLKVFGLILELGFSAYMGYHYAMYFFKEENLVVFGVLCGLELGALLLYAGKYMVIPDEMKRPLIILSFAGLAVMFVQLGCIEVIKSLWGRVRFRDLVTMPNYDRFTPWYHPNGINGNRSFPSGHTASAAMSYLMMLLPFASKKWDKHKFVCFIVPFVYTSIVAFTRLVVGAHFLSDVTIGGVIGFTSVIIAMPILDKKFFKTDKK